MSPWSELRNLNSSKNKNRDRVERKKSPLPFSKAITTWSCGSTDKAAQRLPPQTQTCPVPVTNRAKKKPRVYYKHPRAPVELKVGVILFRSGELRGTNIEHGARGPGGFFFARPGTQVGWFSRSKIQVRSQLRQGRRPAAARSLGDVRPATTLSELFQRPLRKHPRPITAALLIELIGNMVWGRGKRSSIKCVGLVRAITLHALARAGLKQFGNDNAYT